MAAAKIVLVGPGGVGKSKLMRTLLHQPQNRTYVPTLGVEVHPLTLPGGRQVNVWDCAGQRRYGGLTTGYYIAADGFVVLTDERRFRRTRRFVREIRAQHPETRLIIAVNGDLSVGKLRVAESLGNQVVLLDGGVSLYAPFAAALGH